MVQADLSKPQPLISVVTACLNEAPERIRETFSSIAAQSYGQIEQIVVDGGSGEETVAAIREFSDRIDRMISEPDRGIYDAMNKGITLSSGALLLFMNVGDRFVSADTLADMVSIVGSSPGYDYYYGDHLISRPGRGYYYGYPSPLRDDVSNFVPMPRSALKFYLYELTLCHQTLLARRELFERIGGFDLGYPLLADQDWVLRAMAAGARGLHTGITVCEFEFGGTCSDVRRKRQERARLRRQHFPWWERGAFALGWLIRKVLSRLRTRNFALPVRWAEALGIGKCP